MEREIQSFISYLHNNKKTSLNTELSYKRDLNKMLHFMKSREVVTSSEITKKVLEDYLDSLYESGFAAATVSRNIASLKAFFHFLVKESYVTKDISDILKAPKIEKRVPEVLSAEEVICLLEQPKSDTPKEIRQGYA